MKLWASIPLRIALASVFISHALQKIFGIFDGIGIFVFSRNLADLGFSPSLVWAYAIGYAELIAGIFIIIGFCSRICSC
ncbi:MAG: DoxX family protein, partial [Candidatus Omnitrophica bacterium]|nr:DoxX family protein [Candidatus Omnitrophota bacterium]